MGKPILGQWITSDCSVQTMDTPRFPTKPTQMHLAPAVRVPKVVSGLIPPR